jgi:hypothetical protein
MKRCKHCGHRLIWCEVYADWQSLDSGLYTCFVSNDHTPDNREEIFDLITQYYGTREDIQITGR